ncbi:MAG: replication initiation protein [Sulfurimonas sp.]|uniref:replication initiation protein n=1 Tax=Sulfurimonas sp. TaxID=2022749 RepID=UPI00260595FD|nr:replication initiation protein [Sulfurimonas sp.]MDD3476306.1 replication initiation protein [Sulfurimonas sp.]
MQKFQQYTELHKTLKRFNKIRLFNNYGYMNILPVKYLKKNPEKYTQIQLNTDTHFNAIIMDIDDEDLLTEWNAIGLPTPTIQTLNKNNNKAHLLWLLNTPVSKKNKKAVTYYKAIVDSIKQLIGADLAYQNHQTKNFLNTQMYRVTYNDLAYDLGDFKNFIIKQEQYKAAIEVSELKSTGSRHIDLFNQLRFYGYKIAKHKDLKEKLEARAELINEQFNEPIKPKSIIRSVLRFCEENKHNFKSAKKYKTGTMGFKRIDNLSHSEYVKEVARRQKKSQLRTKDIKRIRTASKIKVAVKVLLRKKIKLTYHNISKQAKISLSTAKRYSKIIKILTKKSDGVIGSIRVIVLGAEGRSTNPLKYCFKINSG